MTTRRNNHLCRVGPPAEAVNMETGESVPIEGRGFMMLPGPPGTCEWCHVEHDRDQPHNQQSLPYQMRFHAINGRWPTWTDAMAHCSPEVQSFWREKLVAAMRKHGQQIPADLL
jgi:hypothetical protein